MSFLADAEVIISALYQYYQESLSGEKPVIDQIPIEKLIADKEQPGVDFIHRTVECTKECLVTIGDGGVL